MGFAQGLHRIDMRMRLGQAYMARGLYNEAIVIVQPVVNDPHGSSWSRRAKALVATAQAGMGQAVTPVTESPSDDEEADPATPAAAAPAA